MGGGGCKAIHKKGDGEEVPTTLWDKNGVGNIRSKKDQDRKIFMSAPSTLMLPK
jgi:hypothetical protein